MTIKEFKDRYWYKTELVEFCRINGMTTSGGKLDLSARIEKFLLSGEKEVTTQKKKKVSSTFNWKVEKLSSSTVITDSYSNSENVRSFFTEQIGKKFKFNVKFMNWMKSSQGKTLGDAIDKWIEISNRPQEDEKEIAPQFQYNRYIRDFMRANPGLSLDEAIKCWKIKRDGVGEKSYNDEDLLL